MDLKKENFASHWIEILTFLVFMDEKETTRFVKFMRRDLQDIKNGTHIINNLKEQNHE